MIPDANTFPDFVYILDGKQRRLPDRFLTQSNFDQEPRDELIRDFQCPEWEVTLRMENSNAGRFWLWFNKYNKGIAYFDLPLRVEGGIFTQRVRFIERPNNPSKEQFGGAFHYRAVLQANELNDLTTGADDCALEFYYQFCDHNQWYCTINEVLPKL